MKKTITLLCALVMWVALLRAQSISPQVIGSTGTFATAGSYSLSYTVGEAATATLTGSNNIITQGFQQPNDAYTGLQNINEPALNAQLYPNPATTEINLVITTTTNDTYKVELVDLLGRVLLQPLTSQIDKGVSHYVFNVQQLPASLYFITIKGNSNATIHSFKFNKIN